MKRVDKEELIIMFSFMLSNLIIFYGMHYLFFPENNSIHTLPLQLVAMVVFRFLTKV